MSHTTLEHKARINQYVFPINHSIASINKIIFVLKAFFSAFARMELSGVQDTLVNVTLDTFFSVRSFPWARIVCASLRWLRVAF